MNSVVKMPRESKLVLLYAPWCGFCQKLKAEGGTWDRVKAELSRLEFGTKIIEINVAEDKAAAKPYKDETKGIPQIAIVFDGEVVDRHIGYTPDANVIIGKLLGAEHKYLAKTAERLKDHGSKLALEKTAALLKRQM